MNPTNRCTKDDVETWLKPTLEKEGLEDYTIEISGNSEKGDGYLGDVTFVEVHGKTKTNEEKVFNFVVKSAKKSKELRGVVPIAVAFENEIHYYREILPTFNNFLLEKGVKESFTNYPRCYDTLVFEDMEVLVLENMKEKGYVLHNRKEPMSREYINTVMKVYGKLHAISFALRDQKPDVFKRLSGNLKDFFKSFNSNRSSDVNLYEDIIKAAKEIDEHEIASKANDLNKKLREATGLTDPSDPCAVILHGDCWNNNFMFKYKDKASTVLSDVCLLDFQLSRLASPVYDLSYFLFTCLSEEDVPDFDEIVGLYYENLSSFLRQLGSDPEKMFPFEELMDQWRRFSLFGLMMLPSIARLCLSEKDDVPDLAEAAESNTDLTTLFTKGIGNLEQYGRRTLPIMRLAIDKRFI